MGIIDSFVSYMGFNLIHDSLNVTMERNMSNNFAALFHATGSSCTALLYLWNGDKSVYYWLSKFSTGYFLYDSVHVSKYMKPPMSIIYLYHHFATSYFLHQDPVKYNCAQSIFFAELSNIPSYYVYYLLKRGKDEKKLALAKKIQFCMYSFIRLPIATYLMYDTWFKVDNKTPVYLMFPVYFMGLFWTKALWNNL
jgi:hypothetical protein